eukprot:7282643-Alexandrium_andersonii.AAC.1
MLDDLACAPSQRQRLTLRSGNMLGGRIRKTCQVFVTDCTCLYLAEHQSLPTWCPWSLVTRAPAVALASASRRRGRSRSCDQSCDQSAREGRD